MVTAGKTGDREVRPSWRGVPSPPTGSSVQEGVPESWLTHSARRWRPPVRRLLSPASGRWHECSRPSAAPAGFLTCRGLLEASSRGRVWTSVDTHREGDMAEPALGLSRGRGVSCCPGPAWLARPPGWMPTPPTRCPCPTALQRIGSEMGVRPARERLLGNVLLALQRDPGRTAHLPLYVSPPCQRVTPRSLSLLTTSLCWEL